MSLLGALTSRPQPKNLATPWGDWGSSSQTWAGVNVTPESSLQLLTVFGCATFICDGIATMPVDAYRDSDGIPTEITKPGLLVEPSEGLEFTDWATQFLLSLLLCGNFYGFKIYNGPNRSVGEVIPIDPTKVQVKREGGRKVFYVEGVRYSTHQVLHVKAIMWPGSDVGLSPVEFAKQTIGSGLSAEEYAARYFGDDPTPPGVLETDGEMTPDEMRETARMWSRRHSGKSNRSLPGVLQGGLKWKPTLVNNEQAQFLETRKFTASMIAAELFHIDPVEMGLPIDGNSLTYTNQEERNIRKIQVTFLPWIVRLERALSSCLPLRQYVKLNVSSQLRADTTARFNAYRTALGEGVPFMEVSQVRSLEEWGPMTNPPTPAPSPQETTE